MLFSLIVPVYNTKEYLEDCLHSISIQDFEDYELIIVDDGSTDGSERISDNYCLENKNAKVIHQSNQGLAGARNTGLKAAKGEWIWFIDSDDFIVPGALSALVERMRFAKGDLYAFQFVRTDENGENSEEIFFREFQEIFKLERERDFLWNIDHRVLAYKDGWEAPSRLYKRSIIMDNDLSFKNTKEVFAEDLCFLAEYMMCAKAEVMLVNYLYCYRQRNNSLMNSLDQKTVIPRLIHLLEDNYMEAKRLNKRQTIKNFDTFCYGIFKTHIHKLDGLTNGEIREEIDMAANNSLIGKYVKKVRSRLYTEIDNRRN